MLHICSKLTREENNKEKWLHIQRVPPQTFAERVLYLSERTTHLAKVPWHASDRPQDSMCISDVLSLFGSN